MKSLSFFLVIGFAALWCCASCGGSETVAVVDKDEAAADTEIAGDSAGEQPDIQPDEIAAVDSDLYDDNAVTVDAAEGQVISDETHDADTVPQVAGLYAEKVIVTTVDKMAPLGEFESVGTYFSLTRITKKDAAYISSATSCRSIITSTSPAKTTVPDALTQCIGQISAALTVEQSSGGLKITRAEAVMPVGVVLDDPWNDPLPTDKNDPRIIDADKDGNPGVTIEVQANGMTGKIYSIRRERGSWHATQGSDGRFRGLVQDASQQQVIGANNPIFNVNPESHIHPDPLKSTIELVRLESDIDCAALISRIDELFPK